jgi:hypothetical protein
MNSFSLFLRPIEAEFGWSRTTATVPYMFGMLGWGVGGAALGDQRSPHVNRHMDRFGDSPAKAQSR